MEGGGLHLEKEWGGEGGGKGEIGGDREGCNQRRSTSKEGGRGEGGRLTTREEGGGLYPCTLCFLFTLQSTSSMDAVLYSKDFLC